MENIELDLQKCKQKSITISSRNINEIKEISKSFDLLVCYLMDDKVPLQDIIDELSLFNEKHIKINFIKNSTYFNEVKYLVVNRMIIKNIELTNRYLTMNFYVTTKKRGHHKNNKKILCSIDILMSRKITESESL